MSIKLMYITNSIPIAQIAQKAGVDRIWVDMEYIGKDERQAGLDTVKSHHTIQDIKRLRPYIHKAELMVRVNPIHAGSEREINDTINAGADLIMLPMFKTVYEVERFIDIVSGRTKTILLIETKEAVENLEEILAVPGIDEVHIGLNDLHLSYGQKFMFELLADGTVEKIIDKIKKYDYKYGFGGIARIGYGLLPAELILREHYRLKSEMAILSRSFCNANHVTNFEQIDKLFSTEVNNIRIEEEKIIGLSGLELEENRKIVCDKVQEIIFNCDEGNKSDR